MRARTPSGRRDVAVEAEHCVAVLRPPPATQIAPHPLACSASSAMGLPVPFGVFDRQEGRLRLAATRTLSAVRRDHLVLQSLSVRLLRLPIGGRVLHFVLVGPGSPAGASPFRVLPDPLPVRSQAAGLAGRIEAATGAPGMPEKLKCLRKGLLAPVADPLTVLRPASQPGRVAPDELTKLPFDIPPVLVVRQNLLREPATSASARHGVSVTEVLLPSPSHKAAIRFAESFMSRKTGLPAPMPETLPHSAALVSWAVSRSE